MSLETFQIEKTDIKEMEQRVKNDIKNSLHGLKRDVAINSFLKETNEKNFEINIQNVKDFLESKKNFSRKELVQNRDVAAVTKAVLIVLKSKGIYNGKIDGYLGNSETKKAIEDFQEQNGLPKDGAPGPMTIKKILELLNSKNDTDSKKTTVPDSEKNKIIDLAIFQKIVSGEMDMPESDWEDIKKIPKDKLIDKVKKGTLVWKIGSEDQTDLKRWLDGGYFMQNKWFKVSDSGPKFVRGDYVDLEDFLQKESVSN